MSPLAQAEADRDAAIATLEQFIRDFSAGYLAMVREYDGRTHEKRYLVDAVFDDWNISPQEAVKDPQAMDRVKRHRHSNSHRKLPGQP